MSRITDELLDVFMPIYDVIDRQAVPVAAPADVSLAAAEEMELDGSRIVRAIFRTRELIFRAPPDPTPRPRGLLAWAQSIGWGVLV